MRMERQIEKLYAAWSPSLLAFCCLLSGEGSDAERTVVEAFQAHLRRDLDLDFVGLPLFCSSSLWMQRSEPQFRQRRKPPRRRLQDALVLLPWRERAVFALSSAMGLDDMVVSEIVLIPVQEVRRIWMSAVFRLRELLPKDFSPGRKT